MIWKQRKFFKEKEKNIQKDIVEFLRFKGFYVINCDPMFALSYIKADNLRIPFISEMKGKGWTKGQPDIIVISPSGKVIFAELKTEKGVLSSEQREFKKFCEITGLNYYVWRSLDDCIKSI